MIDIHPPHEAVHTWKDFFIHIATIAVGLLIAIGLEQTVEYVHRQHTEHQAQERIREELQVNQRICQEDSRQTQKIANMLNHDIVLLRALQTAGPHSGEKLNFGWDEQGFYNTAIQYARDSGALGLMPYQQAAQYSDAYLQLSSTTDALLDLGKQLDIANADAHRGHAEAQLTPGEIDDLLAACSVSLGKAQWAQEGLDVSQAELTASLSGQYRDDFGGKSH